MAKLLYVTGFGPFPGVDENPTAEVARALHGTTTAGGYGVVAEVLPTSFQQAPDRVEARIRAHAPRGILHLGLTLLDTVVRVESWAANEMIARVPDVDGAAPFEDLIDDQPDAPTVYETSVPVETIVGHLRDAGFPARVSRNAGRYVCNCVYYRTLRHLDLNGSSARALFVHLPPPSFRPFGDLSFPAWDHDLLVGAASAAIEAFAALLSTPG